MRLLSLHSERTYRLDELTAGLPDPPGKPPRRARSQPRRGRRQIDEQLRAIPARDYVRGLAGPVSDRVGKVSCPLHEDRTPSLQLYEDGTWYCFGCRQGGSIYDFAALLWLSDQSPGVKLRGRQFIEVRDRLAAIFLGEGSAAGSSVSGH